MPFLGASFLPTNGAYFTPTVTPQAVYLKWAHLTECKVYLQVNLNKCLNLRYDSAYKIHHTIGYTW